MMQKRAAALAAALLLFTAGCGAPSAPAEPEPSANDTLYDCGGLTVAIPAEYADVLEVTVGGSDGSHAPSLLRVYEKASRDAYEADSGSREGVGFLFGIVRMDQVAYEHHLIEHEYTGSSSAIAVDGDGAYYAMTTPTDMEFYRADGKFDTDSADWKAWESLGTLGETVCADFVTRNGLTPFNDDAFFQREYVYDGAHAFVKYYDYYTFDGDKRMWDTLVLSQPATQGEGGIWCVEQFYDVRGTRYYNLPDVDVPLADYYASLQAQCDAGALASLLTPLGAAEDFTQNSNWHINDSVVPESFELVDAPDTAYFKTNEAIPAFIYDIESGRDYDEAAFLACVASFTPDTWGVLGRFNYGSDWWTPLKDGLTRAAVGPDQQTRDAALQHLYCTVPGAPYAAEIAALLEVQRTADGTAFAAALASLSPEDQAVLTAAGIS